LIDYTNTTKERPTIHHCAESDGEQISRLASGPAS
jgi:hypothetical protein